MKGYFLFWTAKGLSDLMISLAVLIAIGLGAGICYAARRVIKNIRNGKKNKGK